MSSKSWKLNSGLWLTLCLFVLLATLSLFVTKSMACKLNQPARGLEREHDDGEDEAYMAHRPRSPAGGCIPEMISKALQVTMSRKCDKLLRRSSLSYTPRGGVSIREQNEIIKLVVKVFRCLVGIITYDEPRFKELQCCAAVNWIFWCD